MRLHQLIKSKGLHKKAVRRGRGNATGTGNYSGRGLKGQKSRSGHGMRPFFEGGQTSIVQRLPKARGFTRYFKLVDKYQVINLGKLNLDGRVSDKMEISKAVLKQLGYIKNDKGLVKLLGDGEYSKHLTFTDIDAYSTSAKAKLEKPGTASKTAGKPYAKIDKSKKKSSGTSKMARIAAKLAKKAAVAKKPAPVKKAVVKKPTPITAGKPVVEKKVAPAVAKPVAKKVEVEKAKIIEKKSSPVKNVEPAKAPAVKKLVTKASTTADKPAKAEKPIAARKPAAKAPAKKAPAKKAK